MTFLGYIQSCRFRQGERKSSAKYPLDAQLYGEKKEVCSGYFSKWLHELSDRLYDVILKVNK